MIELHALIWLDTPIVPPPCCLAYAIAWVRFEWPRRGPPPAGTPPRAPPGGAPPPGPPPPGPRPPNEALAVPPAGNVPLVVCPSVWNDHVAGAINSATSA